MLDIRKILYEFYDDISFIMKYNEKHRFYHNLYHIYDLIEKAGDDISDELFLAIIFHDIIYDPRSQSNEKDSVEFYKSLIPLLKKEVDHDIIIQAILDTKEHVPSIGNDVSNILCDIDMSIIHSDYNTFVTYEDQIRREYNFVDIETYKKNRLSFLIKNNVNVVNTEYVRSIYSNWMCVGEQYKDCSIREKTLTEICPKCFVYPRIWIFQNGRFAKCLCSESKYSPALVRTFSIIEFLEKNNNSLIGYDSDNKTLFDNWNKYVSEQKMYITLEKLTKKEED
jgi:predicted metal-dependent HD superfamily phosphohydrolase